MFEEGSKGKHGIGGDDDRGGARGRSRAGASAEFTSLDPGSKWGAEFTSQRGAPGTDLLAICSHMSWRLKAGEGDVGGTPVVFPEGGVERTAPSSGPTTF